MKSQAYIPQFYWHHSGGSTTTSGHVHFINSNFYSNFAHVYASWDYPVGNHLSIIQRPKSGLLWLDGYQIISVFD